MTDYDNLIDCLKQALACAKEKGITKLDIAKKSGVSTVTLHYWITGEPAPNTKKLISVINACGYSLKFKMVKS